MVPTLNEEQLKRAEKALGKLEPQQPEPRPQDELIKAFVALDEIPEQKAEWLIPGWLPKGQIATFGANGGVGKTSIWCHIGAKISCGGTCILDPPDYKREPARVIFLTSEDSVRVKLKRKIRLAGANMKNIITPDFVRYPDLFNQLKFGTPAIGEFVRYYKPALVIFDPIQGFVPPNTNMCARNEMRNCLAPLTALGEETGTAFLLVCHTNKRKNASGRDRISDSADLWDISRSVWMAGFAEEEDARYLSNEKNNYAALQETVLFNIDAEGQVHSEGTTWKRDKDYMDAFTAGNKGRKKEDCAEYIEQSLIDAGGGVLKVNILDAMALQAGFSKNALREAKQFLKSQKRLRMFQLWDETAQENVFYAELMC